MVFYAKYGLGLSLAAIPAYAAGRALAPLARDSEKGLFTTGWDRDRARDGGEDDVRFTLASPEHYRFVWYPTGRDNYRGALTAFFAALTNAALGGAITAALYLCALELGFAAPASLALAVLCGLATPLWHYARTFFAEPLAAFGVLLFLLGALRGRRPAANGWWAASGAGLGLAVLAKPVHLVLLAPAGLYLGMRWREGRRAGRRAIRGAASWAAGFGVPALIVLVYNLARFGSPWETGYGGEAGQWTTPFLRGLEGLLVSPGRGLLIYHPLWILAAWGFARFTRRARHEAIFTAASLATLLVTYASWHQWEGGWCWGPRFLLVVVPLLMLPVAALLDPLPRTRPARLALGGVVAVGLVVAMNGIIVHYVDYLAWLRADFLAHSREFAAQRVTDYYQLMCWRWDYAPIVRYWGFERKEPFLLLRAMRAPGLVLGLYAVFALGLAASVWRLRGSFAGARRES